MTASRGRQDRPQAWRELDEAVEEHLAAAEAVSDAARLGDIAAFEAVLAEEVEANDRYARALTELGFSPPFGMRTSE